MAVSSIPPPINEKIVQPSGEMSIVWIKFFQGLQSSTGISTFYAVGQIAITTVNENPATTYGYGTWVAFGTGRLVLDVDAGSAENLSSTITVYLWKRTV